ncbi:hypothetical protein [Flavobacterium sp.]|uniref:hypothetical protein n=1 Tax=Flavobacterium sp. TaxID=239 RepID=UPI00286DD2B4|nr:hypothetical protein [Flavobacterium sp.]
MKKLNLVTLLLLCCLSLSCNPKTEKEQPTIYNNSNNNQNYKFDDDVLLEKNTKNVKKKKPSHKYKSKKVGVKI